MNKSKKAKPTKKKDKELYELIVSKINSCNYIITKHAKKRSKDRRITDLVILNLLQREGNYRHRNKSNDKYENNNEDWNYCIEGEDFDSNRIEVIVSFEDDYLMIITVIRLD